MIKTSDPEMDKAQSTKDVVPQVTIGQKLKNLLTNKDFKKFLNMKSAVGELDDPDSVSSLDEPIQKELIAEYNRWEKAGKPSAKKSDFEQSDPVITSLYRMKYMGKQKIYAYLSNGKYIGLNLVPEMTVRVDGKTGASFTTNEPTGALKKQYTEDYTLELGNKLLEQCLSTAVDESGVGLYIWDAKTKYTLTPQEFNEDFDSLIAIKRKESHR
jgi:hypothetical protein